MKKTTTILLNRMGANIQYSDEGGAFALAEAVVYELGKGVRRAFAAQSLEFPWPISLSVVRDEPGEEWGEFFPDVQQLIPVSESEDLSKICGEDTVLRVHMKAMLEELEDVIRHKID